jgi:hypothetical protein
MAKSAPVPDATTPKYPILGFPFSMSTVGAIADVDSQLDFFFMIGSGRVLERARPTQEQPQDGREVITRKIFTDCAHRPVVY